MGVGVVRVRVCTCLDKRVGMGVYIGSVWRREPWKEAVEREKREEQGMGGGSCVQWGDGAGKGREKRETRVDQ